MQRTLAGETPTKIGQKVKLQGWVESKRDHGKITFIDLRDRSGVVQVVGFEKLAELRVESVVEVQGEVKQRGERYVNADLHTGQVEVEALEYQLLNDCAELPISLDGDGLEINEVPRLKYRYVDLRRPRMQKNLRMRSNLVHALRDTLIDQDFVEIETPLLTKSTKEGARDFLVPSRFQPGKFYALPQSPQQYKQLLMTAGFERYFQFAKCIRDEDLRADRGFEFTQLDLEMSFVTQEEVMQTVEEMVKAAVHGVGGVLVDEQFPVYTYQQAIKEFGQDKFDLRTPPQKKVNQLAFAWVIDFPFFKKVDKSDAAEVQDGKSGWTFTHNPFSSPQPEYLQDHLQQKNIANIKTAQYDLICNGYEVGGGSIRAHQPEVLRSTLQIMGYSEEEIEESVGHMLQAFKLGTPPHGGIALGLDRLAMLLAGEDSIKETVAFPTSSTGRAAVMDAPNEVDPTQLRELGLSLRGEDNLPIHDQVVNQLKDRGVNFRYFSHQPVTTSEEAAQVRGTNLSQSAKALIVEADSEYLLLVIPGDKKADLDGFQKSQGYKKLAMASRETVKARTGLEVGSIPPFGSLLNMTTFLDNRLLSEEEIAFNVGRRDRSVIMRPDEFIRIEKPELVDLS